MCAFLYEEVEIVQALLEGGALACINTGVITPICYAAQSNHKVDYLFYLFNYVFISFNIVL